MARIDDLQEQIDADLNSLFASIAREIDTGLSADKPNIPQIERRVTGKLGSLFGFTREEVKGSPLGIYFQGAISAARQIGGGGVGGSLDTEAFGQDRATTLWNTGVNLRSMIIANLRSFVAAKPGGKVTKESVRSFFRSFLTVDGAKDKIGQTGDHGLYEVRRHLSYVVRQENAVGVKVSAIRNRGNVAWRLHPRHPKRDICDVHATADLHGLGPGVYPPQSVPRFPPHPHCICYLEETT